MIWSRRIRLAIGLGFVLRLSMALWNGIDGPSFGAANDATNFQQFAVAVSEGRQAPGASLTGFSYGYVLGFIYRFTGPSLLIGSLLSCAAWLASAFLLRATMRRWRVAEPVQWAAQLAYAMLPSSVLWTSVTIREPYQLLSVNLMVWAATMIWTRPTAQAWGVLIASATCGAFLLQDFRFGRGTLPRRTGVRP